jgi:hypothetical protein
MAKFHENLRPTHMFGGPGSVGLWLQVLLTVYILPFTASGQIIHKCSKSHNSHMYKIWRCFFLILFGYSTTFSSKNKLSR